jgi:hypothetical protein
MIQLMYLLIKSFVKLTDDVDQNFFSIDYYPAGNC